MCCNPILIRRQPPFAYIGACTFLDVSPGYCLACATTVAEKVDSAGRHVRQIELCARHCEIVIVRERARGLEISDRRDEIAT